MFSPALNEELARQQHADALCEARQHRLASPAPRERRAPLGMLGRLFGDAPRRRPPEPRERRLEPRTFTVARTSAHPG